MKKLISQLFIIVVTTISCMNATVEFKPIVLEGDDFVQKQPSPDFYSNLVLVLEFYDEDYSVREDGVVLIKKSKSKDHDLMWNYTSKAYDTEWLKNNRP